MKWYGVLFLFFVASFTANLTNLIRMDARETVAAKPAGFVPATRVALPETALKPLSDSQNMPSAPFLLVFFAADCPYCKMQHEVLKTVRKDIPIVGVMTRPDKSNQFEKWLKNGNPYAFVGRDATGQWARIFRVYGIPVSFVVDGKKEAFLRHEGAFTAEKYDAVIREQILNVLENREKNDARP